MTLRSRTVQRTLAYVNRLRALQGRKPLKRMPRGVLRDERSCPIATALTDKHGGARVHYAYLSGFRNAPVITFKDKDGKTRTQYPPQYVAEFVTKFDKGRIPNLIREGDDG